VWLPGARAPARGNALAGVRVVVVESIHYVLLFSVFTRCERKIENKYGFSAALPKRESPRISHH
jgi:hypothetical protein